MILVFAFILTIIIDWGMGGLSSGPSRGVIATVNGDEIAYDEFYQQYQNQLRTVREQSGRDPEGLQLTQLENQVFESLLQQRLVNQEIKRLNLKATDKEVLEQVLNNPPELLRNQPVFQDSNGVFDMRLYQQALDNPEMDWVQIENYIRMTLPYSKLENLLRLTATASEADAWLLYLKQNAKAKVDYIFYNADAFTDQVEEPDEKEIAEFYSKHKEDYRLPERRQLDYILLETKATPADTQMVYMRMEEILADLRSGADFLQMASIYSEDPGSAQNGGDLGYFARSAMVEEFADAAFGAKIGSTVGPVKTQFGLHLIKVEDRKKENGEDKVQARHILLKFDPSPATREALREEAAYVAEYAKEVDFRQVVESENLKLQSTPPFEADAYIPGIGMEPRISRFAFRGKEGDVSDVYETNEGYVVAMISAVIKEHIQPLTEVRNQIVTEVKNEKSKELARAKAQAAYDRLQQGAAFDQIAEQDGLSVKNLDSFLMNPSVRGLGNEPEFVGTAFSLEVGQVSPPVKGSRGYYLIQLLNKTGIDEEKFQAQKENLKLQVLKNRQSRAFSLWYEKLKEQSDIQDYRQKYM
ncbi:peptidylprolyl isomerase [candidate division KSB1 bacterium]|nr:peptidylprolyl isomerase [candidate division KSB1 bacterium]